MSRRVLAVSLLGIVALYGAFKAAPLIRGPHIVIDRLVTDPSGLTSISGRAVHTETLSMNGGTLLIASDGAFEKSLMLPRGSAILSFTATDRFGRTDMVRRSVLTP